LFFVSFIESVPKVEQSKQSSNIKLSKEMAVTVTQANHEVTSEQIIQQAVLITPPQSDKCYQHNEARRLISFDVHGTVHR
jgi:hypothetical protein